MIVHQYNDGSEGYEYEVGDVVRIKDVTPCGAWFKRVVGRVGTIEKIDLYKASKYTAHLYVRDSPDWGPSSCFPWMVEPTQDTKINKVVSV